MTGKYYACVSRSLVSILLINLLASQAKAIYVIPQMGGGQVGAMMRHTDVMFDGTQITLHVDDTVAAPTLRPLTSPDQFDPAQPWAVLQNKAYNFQNAWNPGGFITLPPAGAIWIERLHHDPGLQAYLRPPASSMYDPIFTLDKARWQWSGAMQHNTYAVLNPSQSVYTAGYRVYIGDVATGSPLAGYGSAEVTWTWNATPVPEPTSPLILGTGVLALAGYRRCRKHH